MITHKTRLVFFQRQYFIKLLASAAALMLSSADVFAEKVIIAVATNFLDAATQIKKQFEQDTHHSIKLISGSSGKIYAQIVNGAPFDAFFSADQKWPKLLEKQNHTVYGSRFTYARGRLILWSANPQLIRQDASNMLREGKFRKIAIANPEIAPYGVGAKQTLENLKLYQQLKDRIVIGENVGQAYAMIATQNAEVGIIAFSYLALDRTKAGSYWEIPEHLYNPINQDAVMLKRGQAKPAVHAFIHYVKQPKAAIILSNFGYVVDND